MEVENILQNIILKELNLPTDYGIVNNKIVPSVYVYSPLVSLGATDKIQIGIKSIDSFIVGNNKYERTKIIDGKEHYQEVKEVTINDTIQIDISSKNNEARLRRYEVVAALTSTQAKYAQDKYNIRIFDIPSRLNNTQRAEGTANIYRYTMTCTVQHMKVYIKDVDYYDTFSFKGWIDSDKKEISFTIDKDTPSPQP